MKTITELRTALADLYAELGSKNYDAATEPMTADDVRRLGAIYKRAVAALGGDGPRAIPREAAQSTAPRYTFIEEVERLRQGSAVLHACVRFLSGVNFQDHPIGEQRQARELLRNAMAALKGAPRADR